MKFLSHVPSPKSIVLAICALSFGICFKVNADSKLPIVDKTKSGTPHAQLLGLKTVRVGLFPSVEVASVECESPIQMWTAEDTYTLPAGKYPITASRGKIMVGDRNGSKEVRLSSKDGTSYLTSNSKTVRGDIAVVALEEEKLSIVNELDVDSYLKGVLPGEAIVSWPLEALKVQAVASRTYMASHMGRHKKEGFDVCSDVHCQVYKGVSKENPNTNKAVEATKGEILIYNGKPIGAYFHALCGGSTEKIKAVWGNEDVPYLPAKKCNYGNDAPWYTWSRAFSMDDILEKLEEKDLVKGNKLKSISIKKKSQSGRAEIMTVKTDAGSFDMLGNSFRLALHPEKIRSTLFTEVSKIGDGYRFEGKGWGHGVGLCQWGSRGQVDEGKKYKEILEYYFPHTELHVWKD